MLYITCPNLDDAACDSEYLVCKVKGPEELGVKSGTFVQCHASSVPEVIHVGQLGLQY